MFRRDRRGATAIEFALVALPFAALLFAVLQTAIVFTAGQVLETAVTDAARLILTGRAQNGGFDAARFKQELCAHLPAFVSCDKVAIDVKTMDAFPIGGVPLPIKDGKLDTTGFGFQPGTPGQIVVVRAVTEYPVFIPYYPSPISNLANGNRLLMATAAFRSEPFQPAAPSGGLGSGSP
ncbi:pilus assembly protein [Chelatococcus sp. SYSU_G07232]|uniref:Pilus assembly protein n=1 Tax=Chelatococcus albus TaxID=3047466 RepID=A0ABT7AE36_9HYPH|nr:TadE/TadG family type IV pilus assembly protein [Chelatococcus sp. SYSU_G07232]MDJ1157651.1 pilus assembly protein [Chelatococcus sp. SYSU_G07232]